MTSVGKHTQKGQNATCQHEEKSVRSSPVNAQVSGGRKGGEAPGTGGEIHQKPVGQAMVQHVFPCSPWRSIPEQVSAWQHVESTMPEQVDIP